MPSPEQIVKDQFARIFESADWPLFKEVAEANLLEAAKLKRAAFPHVRPKLRLLVRNARKRLLIGVGIELLLKSIYLKQGYAINQPKKGVLGLELPFRLTDAQGDDLDPNQTYTLAPLIDKLGTIVTLRGAKTIDEGLRIAKVFRNKEGHMVTAAHKFEPESYKTIAQSLVRIYDEVFGQKLVLNFSLAPNENGVWRVAV
jgi:hypothetical protein